MRRRPLRQWLIWLMRRQTLVFVPLLILVRLFGWLLALIRLATLVGRLSALLVWLAQNREMPS